jgi:hypothetical protein
MTYGFFGVYKAVALPLSYRGKDGGLGSRPR